MYRQLCPSLEQRPQTGCSLLHRTFLSLQLSQARRFPLPLLVVLAAFATTGDDCEVGLVALFAVPESLPDTFLGRPAGGMFRGLGLVQDEKLLPPGEALTDMEER